MTILFILRRIEKNVQIHAVGSVLKSSCENSSLKSALKMCEKSPLLKTDLSEYSRGPLSLLFSAQLGSIPPEV